MPVVSQVCRLSATTALFLVSSVASAQILPAPAPQPSKQQAAAKPTPTVAPTPKPTPQTVHIPSAPIIIGEPVRQQTPAARAKPVQTVKPVVVGGVVVTGLSDAVALQKLQSALGPRLKDPIRLVIGEYQYTFERGELGASIPYATLLKEAHSKGSVPLRFHVDKAALSKALSDFAPQISDDFERTRLNLGGSIVRVQQALQSSPLRSSALLAYNVLPEVKETPKTEQVQVVSQPSSKAPKGFSFLLAEFSTSYNAGLRGRTTNLRMAANNINGTVVAPGKVFSTNMAIGPRNASAGWKEAKMFVSGRVVSGTGSGICQAASTLYNAALLANMPIVERYAHSMRVTYVPPSRDAALMWGSKDFKFRNTSGTAIKVETFLKGGKFHARLWGQKPRSGPAIQVTSRVLSRSGSTRSEAYKIVGSKKILLSRDSYKPVPSH